ncbi:MAG: DUF4129 domain-containing protein [Armatimonadetes bacterium]|nr:DUF4129 domain-containing protein [Armatimonadota bacterium]
MGAGGAQATTPDPEPVLKQILAQPEFQPVARPADPRLLDRLGRPDVGSWFRGTWDWLTRALKRIRWPNWRWPDWLKWRPREPTPSGRTGGTAGAEGFFWVIGGLALAAGIGFLVYHLLRDRRARSARRSSPPPALPTAPDPGIENALARSVDDWEALAHELLARGDARAALRAVYLATLVHLHQQRAIEYDSSRTNRSYVRTFRGAPELRAGFARVTDLFDRVWYGGLPCESDRYYEMEAGARKLGTPLRLVEAVRG